MRLDDEDVRTCPRPKASTLQLPTWTQGEWVATVSSTAGGDACRQEEQAGSWKDRDIADRLDVRAG